MSQTGDTRGDSGEETVHRAYPFDVRVVELSREDGDRYRFEAPEHAGRTFETAGLAELYADVYFDVNGFEEAGTGERGVPPVIIQAGRDTLAAYLLTQRYTDQRWVASFFGCKPEKVQRYRNRVETRGADIRRRVREEGLA